MLTPDFYLGLGCVVALCLAILAITAVCNTRYGAMVLRLFYLGVSRQPTGMACGVMALAICLAVVAKVIA